MDRAIHARFQLAVCLVAAGPVHPDAADDATTSAVPAQYPYVSHRSHFSCYLFARIIRSRRLSLLIPRWDRISLLFRGIVQVDAPSSCLIQRAMVVWVTAEIGIDPMTGSMSRVTEVQYRRIVAG
jgi:hypothetical protein